MHHHHHKRDKRALNLGEGVEREGESGCGACRVCTCVVEVDWKMMIIPLSLSPFVGECHCSVAAVVKGSISREDLHFLPALLDIVLTKDCA